jgi:monoamine oxidase
MARTALFAAVNRALRFQPHTRALSRRQFLASSAALALAACNKPAVAKPQSIAIVGAGTAGLTVAYRLAQAGRAVTLYEASGRVGGRMFTQRTFNEDGQFCELGGELIDTNHEAIRKLAAELGLPIDPLDPKSEGGEEIYHFGGKTYTQRDMLDPKTGKGAFVQLGSRIAEDQEKLLVNDEWTDHARALDQQSLADYLKSLGNLAPRWALDMLDVAYHGEMGLPTSVQSALALIDFIGLDMKSDFKMFGDSDEAFRLRGGSQTLPDTLAAKLPENAARRMRHALAAVAKTESGVRLTFDAPEGRVEREHERVVFALPFTRLRSVQGIDQIGLSAEKLKTIRELAYGDNAKLMVGTKARPWNAPDAFKVKPAGVFFSDKFQEAWDTSRGQAGDRGILTNFLSGVQDKDAAISALRDGLGALSPAMAASLDERKLSWMAWAKQPFTLGSYSAVRVGQYTTLLEHTASPSEDGRFHFVGEHTSSDFQGFMNGAVDSGERCAAELLGV